MNHAEGFWLGFIGAAIYAAIVYVWINREDVKAWWRKPKVKK